MKARLAVLILLIFTLTGLACSRDVYADKPRIGGSLVSGFGAIPGDSSIERQRFGYEVSLSNTGATLPAGWRWEVTVSPELLTRALTVQQDPASGTARKDSAWVQGETLGLKGYVDFNAAGLTKDTISAIKEPVVVRIIDSAGAEVARIPVH
ncbi:MAG: hypothetical protein ACYC5Y_15765 [Symbiobacteriia bacterium]